MKRQFGFFALLIAICVAATSSMVVGQDRVDRRDKKSDKTVTVSGKIIEETNAGVKVKVQPGNREELIPSSEIVRIAYAGLPAKAQIDLGKLNDAEARRDYAALLKGYEAIIALPEMKTASDAIAKRYIEYRVATLRALVADGDESVKASVKGLNDFVAANPESWEYPHAARTLGRLQADLGDFVSATKTFETLEKGANVPAEFKQEASIALIDVAFQGEKYDEASKKIDTLAKSATPAIKDRLTLYQLAIEGVKSSDEKTMLETIKKIEAIVAKTQDTSMRALAYNAMGDCYNAKGKKRDAMWSYLSVDVVYNQDRGEYVKALSRLIKIFQSENDDEKVKMYKEKLNRAR